MGTAPRITRASVGQLQFRRSPSTGMRYQITPRIACGRASIQLATSSAIALGLALTSRTREPVSSALASLSAISPVSLPASSIIARYP